jgi:hypothetical protein
MYPPFDFVANSRQPLPLPSYPLPLSVLWLLLTSHSALLLQTSFSVSSACKTSPGKRDNLPLMCLPHLHHGIRAVLDFTLFGKLVHPINALLCGFCPSDRGFASGFLQIPPHDGHPCLQLTVPTAKPVEDFHLQVIAHAGHTIKSRPTRAHELKQSGSIVEPISTG